MAAMKRGGLGRGLGALLPTEPSATQDAANMVPTNSIYPNPRQPRANFNETELAELAESIREHGIIQPLIVADAGDGTYTLIAGERRLRASELAGLSAVPVIIRQVTDKEMLELALIENVQREDLSPLETAEAYHSLESSFNMTHEEISRRVGKNRVSVTNTLRLLKLPETVKSALAARDISEGHARVLLSLPDEESQINAMKVIIANCYNVRQTEEYIRSLLGKPETPPEERPPRNLSPELKVIEQALAKSLGNKVSLKPGKNGTGTIRIHYKSEEDLAALVRHLAE